MSGDTGSRPYPPRDEYGLVGDLRSAALISRQGSIDWLCLPRFDSPSVFGRILDWERGGSFELTPADEAQASRTYRTHSNVLETVWTAGRRQARVVDLMPIAPDGGRKRPPKTLRLVRLLQPARGTMAWRAQFNPRFEYGAEASRLANVQTGLVR